MKGRPVAIAAAIVIAGALAWIVFVGVPQRYGNGQSGVPSFSPFRSTPAAASPSGRTIKARLFYVAGDGAHLTSIERDVAYGDGALDQAREIVAAQIAAVPEPLVSAVPEGTTLRALFITDRGDAYVDLSGAIVSGHPGGVTEEMLTVYSIVNALTANLPAVSAVQILIDGKEVETLAGHLDLRRPLEKNTGLIQ
ncbi:MAG TPA: GerMN domain-containing protein [Vicinamibacterales bacterium]|nr:GerMN domain-containing protein [Vicinamibacterales bacterium]